MTLVRPELADGGNSLEAQAQRDHHAVSAGLQKAGELEQALRGPAGRLDDQLVPGQ